MSWGGRVVARHHLVPAGSDDVWEPAHRAAAEAAALRRRRPLHLVKDAATPAGAVALELPFADFDVEPPDLVARYGVDGGA